ncbi:hypothetical protein QBC45DRAFT_57482 [Copromyces sp. CBS 386.78]|nr:hypothetical protein QBC45DRAFT_57482 [Copromyces sp. CBS 386.78]
MPGNRRYPPERIRYASYIWPADWQPERTSTSTSTSTQIYLDPNQQGEHCACCIRSYYYVTPSPQAFQRHRLVLSRCEQLDPWLLDRHGYSKLISDATSVVLWAIWTNLVYDSDLLYMSVDYFYFLIDWLLWRVYVPTEPFPFAFHPPTKTGPPYSDVVEYFFCRSDGLSSLEGIFANLHCSSTSRYHTGWKMLQAIRNIFNGQDYYVGYGGSCQCGPRWTSVPLVKCVCLPWPRPREPVVVVRVEETTTWKKRQKRDKKKKKKKSKESGCVVM